MRFASAEPSSMAAPEEAAAAAAARCCSLLGVRSGGREGELEQDALPTGNDDVDRVSLSPLYFAGD